MHLNAKKAGINLMCGTKFGPVVIRTLLAAAMAALIAPVASYSAEDVSGSWDLAVESRQGTARPTITFRQEGEKLSGTYQGRMGEVPLQGTLKGNSIQFSLKLKFRDQDIQVTYTGTVEGDAMKGTVQFGDSGSGSWTARRKS